MWQPPIEICPVDNVNKTLIVLLNKIHSWYLRVDNLNAASNSNHVCVPPPPFHNSHFNGFTPMSVESEKIVIGVETLILENASKFAESGKT